MKKILIALFILLSNAVLLPQSDSTITFFIRQVPCAESTDMLALANQKLITWNYYPTVDNKRILWYNVYYVAGNDTSKFPFWNGVSDADTIKGFVVNEWKIGTTLYNKYVIRIPDLKFVRVGVIGMTVDGYLTKMFYEDTFEIKEQ